MVRDGQLVFGNEFYQLSFSLQGVLRPHSQAQPCRNTKHMRIHRDRRQVVHDRRDHVGGLPSYPGSCTSSSTEEGTFYPLNRSTSMRAIPARCFALLLG